MIDSILQQAPDGVSREEVEELWKKHDGNVPYILGVLWDVQSKCQNVAYDENSLKWKNVREICQAYEEEMEKFINGKKMPCTSK